jgi:large subunit ribosomal protein L4
MELQITDRNGKKTSKKAKLDDSIFGIEPNDHILYLDVRLHQANKRQGTHKSKERADVAGSTRKIKKQKGTGTARAGSKKSPLFKGGGTAFGPRPRDYSFKLNKKQRKLARKSALTYKAKDEKIIVLEDLKFDAAKTKDYVSLLNNLDVAGAKSLLVLSEADQNILLASKNVNNAKVVEANELNTYDILNANNVILVESSIEKIENLFN